MQPLINKCNYQAHLSTNELRFSLTLLTRQPRPVTVIGPFTQPDDASTTKNLKVLRLKILYQVSAMQDKISNTLTKQQAKYTWYFDNKICMISTLTVRQQDYVDRPPLTWLKEDGKRQHDRMSHCRKELNLSISWM